MTEKNNLHKLIKNDMVASVKVGDTEVASMLKYTLGEFSRLKGSKDGKELIGNILTDVQVIRVIKKIIEAERKVLELKKENSSLIIKVLSRYLPKLIDEQVIKTWITNNIDFSKFNNKMQAIGIVKKEFGDSVDAKIVKNIIQTWEV